MWYNKHMKRPMTNSIVLHHSVTPQSWGMAKTIEFITRSHIARGLAYDGKPAYHLMIGKNWQAITRPENTVGYHSGVWSKNLTSFAIMLAGNFNVDTPTDYQIEKLREAVTKYSKLYNVNKLELHRDIKPTACPGMLITHDWLQENDIMCYNQSMNCEKEISELNTEIGRVTEERDECRDALKQETQNHKDSLDHLDGCKESLEKCRESDAGRDSVIQNVYNAVKNWIKE